MAAQWAALQRNDWMWRVTWETVTVTSGMPTAIQPTPNWAQPR